MRTLDEVLTALRNAHNAGDTGAAKRLAQIADGMRQGGGAYQSPFAQHLRDRQAEREAPTVASETQGLTGAGYRGLAGLAGLPVDLTTAAINAYDDIPGFSQIADLWRRAGVLLPENIVEQPIGGSQSIQNAMGALGAPVDARGRSPWTRVGEKAIEYGVGGLGATGLARALPRFAGPMAERLRAAFAENPVAQTAVGTTSGIGAGIANEVAPGNKWAELAGGLIGGAGGIGALSTIPVIRGATQGAINIAGLQNPTNQARKLLATALRRDSATPTTIQTRMDEAQRLGVPLAPVDAAGRNTLRLGRTVETAPGAGSEAATQYLSNRQLNQGPRVIEQLNRTLADPTVFRDATQALFKARSAAAGPLYDEAFAVIPEMTPRLKQFLDDPIIQQGLNRGKEVQRLEMLAEGAGPPPSRGFGINQPSLSMRDLDAVKRGLDDILEGYRDPMTGRLMLDQRGRAIENLRQSYVAYLDELNPKYAAARSAWGGPSEALDAMSFGRRFAAGDLEDMAARFKELDPTMREFFRLGLARELRKMIDKGGEGVDAVRRIFGTRDQQARLKELFPSEEAFNAFSRAMGLEKITTSTTKTITGGSATGRIAAEQTDAATQITQDVATGITQGPGALMMQWLGRGVNRARGLNEATAEELARALFSENPAALRGLLNVAPPRMGLGRQLQNVLPPSMLRQLGASYGEQR